MEWDNQRSSISSNPNNTTSQSVPNNPQRTDKVQALQQLSPSPSVSTLSKLTDDDLRRKGLEDLVKILRRVESDYKSLLGEHGNIVKDVNRRYQIFVLESRGLKEVNQKLQEDNQELRDLCCFLDDDRQRGRKLAREWQRFGRYTASVMRSEVAVYQEKLHELEERQCELVKENMELKELCLFLDQERGRITGDRDEGDGSSNGTVTGQEDAVIPMDTSGSNAQTSSYNPSVNIGSGSTNYIRELEQKVQRLEGEKRVLAQKINRNSAEGLDDSIRDKSSIDKPSNQMKTDDELLHGSDGSKSPNPRKPEAVVHAMKVLHIHEELEKIPSEDENLDDTEKAIVREMCNVVWRKLGDVGDTVSFNDSSDSILDPPSIPSSGPAQPVNPVTHGQSRSFTISQPQPQMASTPLSSNSKTVISNYAQSNQRYQAERQAKNQPPLRTSQAPNQPSYQQVLPHQMDVTIPKKIHLPDGPETRAHSNIYRPQDQNKDEQDKLIRAHPFSMPQPFPRPNTHPKSHNFKSMPSHQSSSQPTPHALSATEENLPPHFQSHRHRQQQPQPQVPTQNQYFQPQIPPNAPKKSHSPVNDKTLPHMSRTDSSSSTPTSVPYHPNPNYQHSQPLSSSQQYPSHPIRLLEAPGLQPPRGSESRLLRDENPPILNKPSSYHDSNFSRRDNAISEPNVASAGMYRPGRDVMNENRETSASQMALRPAGKEQERKGPTTAGKPFRGQSLMDNSSGQHLVSSRPQTQSQPYDIPANPNQASHSIKGGFRAYPRSAPPMSVQAPITSHSGSSIPNYRMGNSQPGDMSYRGPGTQADRPKVYQQQEWRQTYLDDSDTL